MTPNWASARVEVQTTRVATPGLATGGYSPSSGLAIHRVKDLLYFRDAIIFAVGSRFDGQAESHVAQDASQEGECEEGFRRTLFSEHVEEN